MKRFTALILSLFLASTAYAGINQQLTQVKSIETLRRVKSTCSSISSNLVSMRQSIEDKLANETANLDATDQTKMNALVTELQEIIDEADDLVTKIDTHYPELE